MLKKTLSVLVFLMLLNSCTTDFKPATFKSVPIDQTFEADVSVVYDKATDHNDLSDNINTNIENAIVSAISNSEKKANLNTVLKEFDTEYINFKKDFPVDFEPVWELHIETEVIYQSNDIITLAISTYEFKGGAHGNDKIKFLNLNAVTGNILSLNDMVKGLDGLKNLAKIHFIKSLKTEGDDLEIEDFFFGEPFQLPENIGFSEDGLVFLYNVYEVASYNQGYTEFIIPYKDLEANLKVN
jgi:hypothetical protein